MKATVNTLGLLCSPRFNTHGVRSIPAPNKKLAVTARFWGLLVSLRESPNFSSQFEQTIYFCQNRQQLTNQTKCIMKLLGPAESVNLESSMVPHSLTLQEHR